MAKRAVITGITGQDGSYLAELLVEKGYEVVGVVRLGKHDRRLIIQYSPDNRATYVYRLHWP